MTEQELLEKIGVLFEQAYACGKSDHEVIHLLPLKRRVYAIIQSEKQEVAREILDYILDIVNASDPRAINSVKLSNVLKLVKKQYGIPASNPAQADAQAGEEKKSTHGPCCNCQKCGNNYDDCTCKPSEEKL